MTDKDSVVLYLEKGDPAERFSRPMTYDSANERAREMTSQGYEVIAIITAEHAAERQAMLKPGGGLTPGAHLHTFLGDIVRRFRQDYPDVPRESVLEVISLLCTLSLEGAVDLQSALLDEIHTQPNPGSGDWRQHMQYSILNRRPKGEG